MKLAITLLGLAALALLVAIFTPLSLTTTVVVVFGGFFLGKLARAVL